MWVEGDMVEEIVLEVKVEVERWVDVVGEIEDAVTEEEVIGVAEVDIIEDEVAVMKDEVEWLDIAETEEEVASVGVEETEEEGGVVSVMVEDRVVV
jgi:hypothetical protein